MKTFKEFLAEMAQSVSIKQGILRSIGKEINAITKDYHQNIPFQQIKEVIEKYGYQLVQEDGTPWSGFLMGGAECGSPEASRQRATIDIVRKEDKMPMRNSLVLIWCKMPSGSYEITAHVS